MKSTPYKIRNNEIYGDLTAWLTAHAGDNESDLMRLKRNLRLLVGAGKILYVADGSSDADGYL